MASEEEFSRELSEFDRGVIEITYGRVLEIASKHPSFNPGPPETIKKTLAHHWNLFSVNYKNLMSRLKRILLDNPELIGVDVFFRAMSWTVINPTLIATGNAHLIPLLSPTVFGSEMWNLTIVWLKRVRQNKKAKKLFGYSYDELDKVGAELFAVNKFSNSNFHHMELDKEIFTVAVSESAPFSGLLKRFTKKEFSQIDTEQLEEVLGRGSAFVNEASSYRVVPFLYQEILIQAIMRTGTDAQMEQLTELIKEHDLGVKRSDPKVKSLIVEIHRLVNKSSSYAHNRSVDIERKFAKKFNIKYPFFNLSSMRLKTTLIFARQPFGRALKEIEQLQYILLMKLKNGEDVNLRYYRSQLKKLRGEIQFSLSEFDRLERDIDTAQTRIKAHDIFNKFNLSMKHSYNKDRCVYLLNHFLNSL